MVSLKYYMDHNTVKNKGGRITPATIKVEPEMFVFVLRNYF